MPENITKNQANAADFNTYDSFSIFGSSVLLSHASVADAAVASGKCTSA